jgi:hypothetical protein
MSWKIASCSVQGIDHKTKGIPCQDFSDYIYMSNENVAIGIVADGAGSARYSEQGARIAVGEALPHLRNLGTTLKRRSLSEPQVREVFRQIINKTIHRFKEEATIYNCSITDFACTLIAFVASSDCLIAFQIGDGFIVLKSKEENTYRLLFMPQKGEFANETTFVTSNHSLERANFCYMPINLEFICASTDGIDHASLDKTKGKIWFPHQGFFEPLHAELSKANNPESFAKEMATFLDSESFSRITGDDKTVVLGVHQVSPVDSVWNSSYPYRLVVDEETELKKSMSFAARKRRTNRPRVIDNTEEIELANKFNYNENFILPRRKKNRKKPIDFSQPFSFTLLLMGLIVFGIFYMRHIFPDERSQLPVSPIEEYTHKLYLFSGQTTNPVGFLVIDPNRLSNLQLPIEAWIYLPYSSDSPIYIDLNMGTAQIPSEPQAVYPIYGVNDSQDGTADMPIGYLYPGTNFNFEEIKDSDRFNPQERQIKVRLILGSVK